MEFTNWEAAPRPVPEELGEEITIRLAAPNTEQRIAQIEEALERIEGGIEELVVRLADRLPQKSLLTKQEVAEYLRISVRQVDRLRAAGELPDGQMIGGRPKFRMDEIAAYASGVELDVSEIL